MIPRRFAIAAALAAASVLVLAGCSAGDATDDGRIRVVASTDVYGQIAQQIGGDLVDVTAIVSSGSQDPHSFEPSARDQLAVSRAALIVENGGGYDAFVDTLIESSGSTAPVVTAVELSPEWPGESADHDEDDHDHDHADHEHIEGFNEHVWYDPHTMERVAEQIADELAEIAPDDAAAFATNLDEFMSGIADLEAGLDALDGRFAGTEIFVTEPVPLALTGAAGLVNVAPDAFTTAVEEGRDVPPATLLEALKLIRGGSVRLVVVNAQTGGAETTAIVDEADSTSIPTVEFTETLPSGQTYLSWMQSNIEALEEALSP